LWLEQRALLTKAQALQAKIGTAQFDDFNAFDDVLKTALKDASVKLETKEKKQFLDAITWKNADAEPVINKVLKTKANPLYGQFEYGGKVVEFVQDGDLRDAENIALNPNVSTTDLILVVSQCSGTCPNHSTPESFIATSGFKPLVTA